MKLREEVKNKFADMGVKWDRNMFFDVKKDSFSDIIDLEAALLFDPEIDYDTTLIKDAKAMLIFDKDADYNTNFRRMLEAERLFQFKYPLPPYKYVISGSRAKLMTEEEIMQREFLKKMGIEQ